jgi:nitrogen-specific signal transduction histidine kinase
MHRPDFGQMLASLSVPVLLISPEHIIAYANDASEAFFGRRNACFPKRSDECRIIGR